MLDSTVNIHSSIIQQQFSVVGLGVSLNHLYDGIIAIIYEYCYYYHGAAFSKNIPKIISNDMCNNFICEIHINTWDIDFIYERLVWYCDNSVFVNHFGML